MPTDRVHRPHQQAQPRIRTPPHGQALHHWACAHVVEGLFMRLWPRPLIVAGIGVVSQGPEEGQTAVPVGGGRAWPGFEKTRRANHQHTRLHWCGGRRRDRRAWLRHPWAAAGPGRGAGGRRQGQAAAPVGGGGAWPGFETTRRAKLAARTASGRAAAHGCIKQPGPANTTKPPGPTGDRAAHASGR